MVSLCTKSKKLLPISSENKPSKTKRLCDLFDTSEIELAAHFVKDKKVLPEKRAKLATSLIDLITS